jgi:hypothetical protein
MHAFNRGFNGNQVGMVKGPQVGPVALVSPGSTAAPAPAGSPNSPSMNAGTPMSAPGAAASPAAPGNPGAIPMGKKANCPVCRTFGG